MRDKFRVAAEHECAHAVVARRFDVHVAKIAIYANGSGVTVRKRTTPEVDAAISAAGDEWDRRFSNAPYEDGACIDLSYQLERVGIEGIWAARRTARKILGRRQDDVHRIADQLLAKGGKLVFPGP